MLLPMFSFHEGNEEWLYEGNPTGNFRTYVRNGGYSKKMLKEHELSISKLFSRKHTTETHFIKRSNV